MGLLDSILRLDPNKYRSKIILIVISAGFVIGISWLFFGNIFLEPTEQQYILLADAFLHKKLYFLEEPSALFGWRDTSQFNGHYYWPLGLFPALLLVPYVAIFSTGIGQGPITFALTLLAIIFLFKIISKLLGDTTKAGLLTFAYMFSTVYFGVGFSALSWYFAHVVGHLGLVLAIYFTLVRPKPAVAGTFFAVAFLSRLSMFLGLFFFVGHILLGRKLDRANLTKLAKLLLPVGVGVLVFFTYNYLRFGDILETGYSFQKLIPELEANRSVGMWSLRHVPTNIYLLFFKGLEASFVPGTLIVRALVPDILGLSIAITSPILFYIFLADTKNRLNKISILGAVPILLFLLGTFGLGAYQFGYRFALDFQPFLFLILCSVFKNRKVSLFALALVLGSAILNSYLIYFRYFSSWGI